MSPNARPPRGSAASAPAAQPIRAVLFDATGTLIELSESVGETYARIALEWGVRLPAWRIDDAFRRVFRAAPPLAFPGLPRERIAAAERSWWRDRVRSTFLAADSSLRFDDFEGCFAALFDHYVQGDSWRLRPGARAALLGLERQELRLGIVSNFDRRLSQILQQLGIMELLDTVMVPARCGAQKPDPRIFAAALHEIDVKPSEAFFLGNDPELDVAAARRAGLRAASVSALASLADLPVALATLVDSSQESQERQPS